MQPDNLRKVLAPAILGVGAYSLDSLAGLPTEKIVFAMAAAGCFFLLNLDTRVTMLQAKVEEILSGRGKGPSNG